MEVDNYFKVVNEIILSGGPTPSEYSYIINVPDISGLTLDEEANIHSILSPILDIKSLLGYTFQKPRGYAGDFELIDRIYSRWVSDDPMYQKWDDLYHYLDSSKAVINRKKYFINEVSNLAENKPEGRVLNLGSGPCTDLWEYLNTCAKSSLHFDCLDMDYEAIEYSQGVCDNFSDNIDYINKNAFRYRPEVRYDMIWSAGLFDYFSDKLFIRLLSRMYELLETQGKIVIGNFSQGNPSRGMMEVFAQWYLHHRTASDLKKLAINAGIPAHKIEVNSEELGVNLFLHAWK